jgi:hypothetical protein
VKKVKLLSGVMIVLATLAVGMFISPEASAKDLPTYSSKESCEALKHRWTGSKCVSSAASKYHTNSSACTEAGFTYDVTVTPNKCINNTGGVQGGADAAQGEDQPGDLFGNDGMVSTIINVLLFVVGILSVVMLIYGGIKYSISAGDAAKVTSAKNTIMYAIVGLVVAILAYAIVNFVVGNIAG